MNGCGENTGYVPGGITVFLTLLFGIILGLVCVTIENVRYLTGCTYIRTAAEAAALAVFGEYNRELYEEYGLFAYGGYGGKDSQELARNLSEQIECALDVTDTGYGTMDIYRIKDVLCTIDETQPLTDADVFYGQIEDYIAVNSLKDLSEQLKAQYEQKGETEYEKDLSAQLDMTDDYENGEYETESDGQNETDNVASEDENKKEDRAGGNPLNTFKNLLRDGVLYLVCDTDALEDEKSTGKTSMSTANLLKELLFHQEDSLGSTLQNGKQKAKMLCYSNAVFSSYVTDRQRSLHYGLEYLATGREEERDCLMGVVNQLLLVRTMMNYAYVNQDVELREESFATATAIAGVLGIPAVVTAIQQTILLILSVEESLVDITALLQGRIVPLMKTKTTFQMSYREICTAGKDLFERKAKSYEKSQGKFVKGYFDYTQYLWIFLLAVPENILLERGYYLIEDDLCERFNQTFTLQQSIYGVKWTVCYSQPLLWSGFYGGDMAKSRSIEAWHSYG